MECCECKFKVFDHHVAGSPCAVYTCGHPDGWCPFDVCIGDCNECEFIHSCPDVEIPKSKAIDE